MFRKLPQEKMLFWKEEVSESIDYPMNFYIEITLGKKNPGDNFSPVRSFFFTSFLILL